MEKIIDSQLEVQEYQQQELEQLRMLAMRHIKSIAKQYPTIQSASSEIVNLEAILNLPKGTEHFLSDIHGEYESFLHVLKNASGVVRRKIDDIWGDTLLESEKKTLATLIYYPKEKLRLILENVTDKKGWYKKTIHYLIKLARLVSSKYTRLKVRYALPKEFAHIIEELLHEQEDGRDKHEYYNCIVNSIITLDQADNFIIAIANVIQRLSIDRLHIIGDIYDRGPGADIIMDKLMSHHSVDVQWGNHDILWMGAAAGSEACIANVMRISLRYANLETLEEGYGINSLPLATFAMEIYGNDLCENFMPKTIQNQDEYEIKLLAKMHKAITIIQFKLESEIIKRRKHYNMEDRLLLHLIDYEKGTITLNGKEYVLKDNNFPTIDKNDPYKLTDGEKAVIKKLKSSFTQNDKLQKHVRFLFSHGSMYLAYNGNLLYHGCIPMEFNGSFKVLHLDGNDFSGKSFMDRVERLSRKGYFSENAKEKLYGMDAMWYLWSGADSPLYGKSKMATFERYLLSDKEIQEEKKNAYYKYRDDEAMCKRILSDFGLDPEKSHIINGHVPVKEKKGESPIKANKKMIVIDGGFSKAYHNETGIAGYTLIYNSYGMLLASHEKFESTQKAIEEEIDIHSTTQLLEKVEKRTQVKDTDQGKELMKQIHDLKMLVKFYKNGLIKEQE